MICFILCSLFKSSCWFSPDRSLHGVFDLVDKGGLSLCTSVYSPPWGYRVIDLQFSQPPLCTWEHRQVPSGLNQGQVFLLRPSIPPEGEAVELITQQPHQNHFQLAITDHPVSQAEL